MIYGIWTKVFIPEELKWGDFSIQSTVAATIRMVSFQLVYPPPLACLAWTNVILMGLLCSSHLSITLPWENIDSIIIVVVVIWGVTGSNWNNEVNSLLRVINNQIWIMWLKDVISPPTSELTGFRMKDMNYPFQQRSVEYLSYPISITKKPINFTQPTVIPWPLYKETRRQAEGRGLSPIWLGSPDPPPAPTPHLNDS